MPNFELSSNSVECDRCGEVFTDESTYISHNEADHGDKEEDFEEVADTYELKMDPNLTEANLREAKKLLSETNQQELYHSRPFKNPKAKIPTKLEPHISADDLVGGVSGYNDNPNAGLYDNIIFRKGSSSDRPSTLGEARANEVGTEICTCGHFGGSTSEDRNQHDDRFQQGHGACRNCNCAQFTWTPYTGESETSNYEVDVDEYLKTGVAIQKTGGGRSELEIDNEERITGEAVAREVGTEICTCGHFGGSTGEDRNQHDDRFQQGHGACRVCNCSQFTWTPYTGEAETDNKCDLCGGKGKFSDDAFGVDCSACGGTGVSNEADNYPQKATMTDNEWEKDLKDLKTRYETENEDVGYDKLGTVTTQGEEQPVGNIPALEGIDFGYENYEKYPTKATETKKRASEVYDGIIDEYEKFQATEDEDVTEMVTEQKLQGYHSESIAKTLTLRYGVSREDALEKVYSIEVSTNDRVANTFFQKKYSECSEAEIKELKMYCGSDL